MEEKKFTIEDVVKICKMLRCTANVFVGAEGEIVGNVNFCSVKREALLRFRKELGLGFLTKKYWEQYPDIDWKIGNLIFNRVEECKIVGYKEEVVPAQPEGVRRVPIYKCKPVV